ATLASAPRALGARSRQAGAGRKAAHANTRRSHRDAGLGGAEQRAAPLGPDAPLQPGALDRTARAAAHRAGLVDHRLAAPAARRPAMAKHGFHEPARLDSEYRRASLRSRALVARDRIRARSLPSTAGAEPV